MSEFVIWVACPSGLEHLLANELTELGVRSSAAGRLGARGTADWMSACRVVLESRLASRVFRVLAEDVARDAASLVALSERVNWRDWLGPGMAFWIHAQGHSGDLRHPHFAAQVVKDVIVRQFQAAGLTPPVIDRARARVQIQLTLGKRAVLGLDLAGRSLHKRGYRIRDAEAPIRENVAAAMLMRAGWPEAWRSDTGMCLVDPMCGSGTILAEAWMMAADMAPGLLRQDFAITRAPWHPHEAWQAVLASCKARYAAGREWAQQHVRLWGADIDAAAVKSARANLAVLDETLPVTLIRADACTLEPGDLGLSASGLMITNPPYGERLGDEQRLRPVYRTWGQQLKAHWGGWRLMMVTSDPTLAEALPLAADKRWKIKNGGLDCILARYDIRPPETSQQPEQASLLPTREPSAFANRLAKNWKKRLRWARREHVKAFRVYDADMPEYAVAIDWYDGWVHVQEYAPPPTIRQDKARRRLWQVLDDTAEVLGVPPECVFLKQRRPQKGTAQYTRQAELRYEKTVEEGQARLWVNLSDFLDTGLFLDHRPTRLWIGEHARDKRFLNLFCYTGAATVHAALGGAARTVSVDLSNTYLDWARRNLSENGVQGSRHVLVRADVLSWLSTCRETFDLIFMDPPTFSNSKKMRDVLDIQRDHVELVHAAMSRLTQEGVLIFSTNYRRFRLDETLAAAYRLEEVSAWSVPPDFDRNRRIHRCWHIRHR